MKAMLICPGERPEVNRLGAGSPLVLAPMLGQTLLEYWLSHLASQPGTEVLVLAHEGLAEVREVTGSGERWGLKVEVAEESRELSPAQALLKHAPRMNTAPAQNLVALLDRLPGLPDLPLYTSYADWFAAVRAWMPRALTPDRLGVRMLRPGVWLGAHANVSPKATLQAPCWIGQRAFVGPGAVIGPGTVVEDGAFIEPAAELAESYVGPDTFVGRFARLAESLALGGTLINWKTGSELQVPDPFLLCALRRPRRRLEAGWLARLAEFYKRNKEEPVGLWKHPLLRKEGGA